MIRDEPLTEGVLFRILKFGPLQGYTHNDTETLSRNSSKVEKEYLGKNLQRPFAGK